MGTMACLGHTRSQAGHIRLQVQGLSAGTQTVAGGIWVLTAGGAPVVIVRGDAGGLQAEARDGDGVRLSTHERDAREREGVDDQVHLGRGGRLQRRVQRL